MENEQIQELVNSLGAMAETGESHKNSSGEPDFQEAPSLMEGA